MSHQDVVFFRNFALVLSLIVVAGLIFYFMAQMLSSPSEGQSIEALKRSEEAINARIRPVGQVRLPGDTPAATAETTTEAPAPQPVAEATAVAGESDLGKGKGVYSTACFACHGSGVAGAPKLGDKAAWEARLTQGIDTLVGNAINGFQGQAGFMPPKGGNAGLSDADVRDAVAYMMAEGQ